MSRSFLFLIVGILAIGVVMLMNLAPFFEHNLDEVHFTHADVRGMAIEHNNLLYTLSFDQQEAVISMINRSLPINRGKEERAGEEVPFKSIVVYRFDQPDVTLKPVIYLEDGSLIYTLDGYSGTGYLRDISAGKMKDMFLTMYDP